MNAPLQFRVEQQRPSLPDWPRLMSRQLAADYVGLGVSTIDDLDGFPRPKTVGRRVLYDRLDLDRWADALGGQPLDADQEASHASDAQAAWFDRRAKRKAQLQP